MLDYASEEGRVKAGRESIFKSVAGGEPVQLKTQQVNGAQSQEEGRESPNQHQQGRYKAVHRATAPPGAEDADQVADDKADDDRATTQQQGPPQPCQNDTYN